MAKGAHSMRSPLPSVLLVSCLLLAGCAGGAIQPPDYRGSNPGALNGAAAEGGIHLQVAGNPFSTDQALLTEVVSRGFERSHFGPPVKFFTTLPEDVKGNYRVRVIFDAPINLGGRELCGAPFDDPGKLAAQVVPGTGLMVATFCLNRQYQATLRARPPMADSPEDRVFQGFIDQVGLSLFPPPSLLQQERGSRNAIIF